MDVLAPVLPNLPTSLELSGRIMLAALLGGLIGLERELRDHPSGVRTHIAVAIGAAMFGIVSAYAFTEFIALRNDNNYQVDVTRVASQVVVGVGFLGGGAIIKQGNTVKGLTSAAGLWVSASIGLAVSLGMYIESIVATATLLIALVLLKAPSKSLRNRLRPLRQNITVTLGIESDPSEVLTALSSLSDATVRGIRVRRDEDEGHLIVEADVEAPEGVLERRLASLESREDVLSVELD